jgi:hypothetical protein
VHATGRLIAVSRAPLLAGLIALLLGGCVATLDHPVERTFTDPISQAEAPPPRTKAGIATEHPEWPLRLSYL